MNKSAIKNFSIEARKLLIKMAVTEAGLYDITKDRCGAPIQKGADFEVYRTIAGTENRIFGDIIKKRANLVKAISEHGFESVMEEAAYTWFNRLIAVRFMEVNDYLPSRVRVLSSETGSSTPDVVTKSLDVDLNMSANEVAAVQKAKEDNKYDEAFRLLFIKQCNELNKILPGLFETTDDYMELLLRLSYTNDGVVRMLVDSVPEEDFDVSKEGQVEIIGWMYQYYNTELKDETFALLKKNVKITKERIPSATQLFTPDWIVRYMVENSLGRLWIEHLRAIDESVDEKATAEEFGWKYYLPEAEQEEPVNVKLAEVRKSYKDMSPLDIKCIDPCMGSGHILVYMFDVLMDIYRGAGYNERDAAFYILENNISGLDIDQRAYQLSYFALMMKGRGYNRRFFIGREIEKEGRTWRYYPSPDVRAIEESNALPSDIIKQIEMNFPNVFNEKELACIDYVVKTFKDAKEYGSILNVDDEPDNEERQYTSVALNLFSLINGSHLFCMKNDLNILQRLLLKEAFPLINELMMQACAMSQKYDVVATNPPYMGNMPIAMTTYVRNYYETSKYDLYSVFMEKGLELTKDTGYVAMITQQAWMFLSSFEKFRKKLLDNRFINMVHLGPRAFEEISGEVVQSTSFVISKKRVGKYSGSYCDLTLYSSPNEKEKAYIIDRKIKATNQENFLLVPGYTFAYWIDKSILELFGGKLLADYAVIKSGIVTGNNDYFLKFWYEIDLSKIGFEHKRFVDNSNIQWVPMHKGGGYRKYYGLHEYVMNLHDIWEPSKTSQAVRRGDTEYYFKKGLTWSTLANNLSVRFSPEGFVFDTKGSMCFINDDNYYLYIGALLNSSTASFFMKFLSPTLDFNQGAMGKMPVLVNEEVKQEIEELTLYNISIAKEDWDEDETSWEFIKNPLLENRNFLIEKNYSDYLARKKRSYDAMKKNEERINDLFANVYSLNELRGQKIDSGMISIHVYEKNLLVKALISYSVGCMLGRYSINREGIIYAGGDWNINQYDLFVPDKDNIIPITDEEYFEDDIVCRFVEFISNVYGSDFLEDNLDFVAKALGTKGNNSREIIRNYFLKDFFKEHCKMYQKRPIYWLFDSGKHNGFKALIYMQRYDENTVGRIRSDYLHKTQNAIEGALKNAEYIISTSSSAIDKAKATKDRDRYIKQLSETRIYDQALAHVALQRIEIDLDDGVKHNYELFQDIEVASEGAKKQTIDLLAKL